MILQRLVEHYDRLAADPKITPDLPKQGYSRQKVSFCVVLNPDGTLQQFQSLLDAGAKKPMPRKLLVPWQSERSSGIKPFFLWDSAAYMLGFVPNATGTNVGEYARRTKRALESFSAFRRRHTAVATEIDSPAFHAVCRFLETWSPEQATMHATELSEITGSFGVFHIANEQRFVHQDPAVVAFWANRRTADVGAGTEHRMCLVTGHVAPIARLHEPKIKGVRGAQSSGALLVSFNEDAYTSLGKDQSYNAPVSVGATFKYANALNHLLSRKDRHILLGDATVVFWAERLTRLEEFVSDLLGDSPAAPKIAEAEDRKRAEEARLFLSQLREGHAGADALDPENLTRFYILGLAPNASRLSVRFWIDSSVGEMKERLAQHLRDVDLVGAREYGAPLSIGRIVRATGRAESDASRQFKGYDAGAVSPLLAGAVARAVLTGGPYPQTLLSAMLERVRADGVVRHERIAAIKACLVRNSRLQGKPREVPVALDSERREPAYVTGRLFALFEKIQSASAGGEPNATITDRFFSAASATPAVVFPRLMRLSRHHLAKMETGQKIYYERQLGEAMNKLDGFARHFGLADQGLFAVGYYHQRQDLYTSKKDREATQND